jgi:hypothetical protein
MLKLMAMKLFIMILRLIGIAVSAPRGLMVPVVRNAESLISRRLNSRLPRLLSKHVTEKYRSMK